MGQEKREQEQETRQTASNIEAEFSTRLRQIEANTSKGKAEARTAAAAEAKLVEQWYQQKLRGLKETKARAITEEGARYSQDVAKLKEQLVQAKHAHQHRLANIERSHEGIHGVLRKDKADRLVPVEHHLNTETSRVDEQSAGEIAIAEQERFERMSVLQVSIKEQSDVAAAP